MADVQLFDFRNCRNCSDIPEIQTVTCVHCESKRGGERRGSLQSLEGSRFSVCVRPRVKLDGFDAEYARLRYGGRVRVYEETGPDAGFAQCTDCVFDPLRRSQEIEAAFGSYLFTPFWNQGDLIGFDRQRYVEHGGHACKLEIEVAFYLCLKLCYIVILDVTPIFAKVRGYSVGAARFADERGLHGIRLATAPGLPDGRNMIDVDVKSLPGSSHNCWNLDSH